MSVGTRRRWGLAFLVLLLSVVGLMIHQHLRYAEARLNAVQDYQAAWHGEVFHVLTFVAATDDDGIVREYGAYFEPLQQLVRTARGTEGTLIYAGQVIHTGLRSRQISDTFGASFDWDAILVQQFDDRAAYRAYLARPEIDAALKAFEVTYTHGFERSAVTNVLLHQLLLAVRVWRSVTFAPDILPFEPSPIEGERSRARSATLQKHADHLGRDAILVVNLARNGTAEEQAANSAYAAQMLGLMADLGYGPMHIGATVSLEHDHAFDQAMLVYYPGSGYFDALSGSTWFRSIVGDKQLADTQACITVPITDALLGG